MIRRNFFIKLLIVALISTVLVLPTTISTSNLVKSIKNEKTVLLEDPPEQFDLRDVNGENYVTGVRNQGSYGTCWCHGVMAAIEGNLMMTGNWDSAGETGEPDLSEAHLDWWNGFNTYNNDDNPSGGGIEPHWGGDYRVASAYIIRGEGAIRESDSPYDDIENPPDRDNPSYHHYYPRDIEWYIAGSDLSNIDTIKYNLMANGVTGTAIFYSYYYIMDFGNYYAHYQPPETQDEPNHAVAICGWDDNKITQAPEPGAWLCKNSWGEWWGPEGGFFWISYYDKWCCQHPEMGAVSFQDVEYEPFEKIYYHDYHGWRDTLQDISEVFNAFTSTNPEIIVAVSFFTSGDEVDYVVKIYNDFIGGELQNELSSETGNLPYHGFHSINLNSPVSINSGEDFYIYLSLSSGGQPIDRTSEVPVLLGSSQRVIVKSDANPGESYYKQGSTWHDLYNYNFSNPSWDGSANFCIKALIGEYVPLIPDLECEGDLSWSNVKPGGEVSGSFTVENVGDSNSILNWEITKWPIWGEWNFSPASGTNLKPEDGKITVNVTVIVPKERNKRFTGEIKIENKDNTNDFEIIQVTLKTPRKRALKIDFKFKPLQASILFRQILNFKYFH